MATPQTDWFGNPLPVAPKPDPAVNPCVTAYGLGPEARHAENAHYSLAFARPKPTTSASSGRTRTGLQPTTNGAGLHVQNLSNAKARYRSTTVEDSVHTK